MQQNKPASNFQTVILFDFLSAKIRFNLILAETISTAVPVIENITEIACSKRFRRTEESADTRIAPHDLYKYVSLRRVSVYLAILRGQ